MTIQETIDRIKYICLNHKDIKSFYIGNTWDNSASKGDVYNCVWAEFPVLIEYSLKQKTYTFSLDILTLATQDDTYDEMSKQSNMEQIADQLLQAFKLYIAHFSMGRMVGLTVKNINADLATGVRIDVQFITNRECSIDDNFKEVMVRS